MALNIQRTFSPASPTTVVPGQVMTVTYTISLTSGLSASFGGFQDTDISFAAPGSFVMQTPNWTGSATDVPTTNDQIPLTAGWKNNFGSGLPKTQLSAGFTPPSLIVPFQFTVGAVVPDIYGLPWNGGDLIEPLDLTGPPTSDSNTITVVDQVCVAAGTKVVVERHGSEQTVCIEDVQNTDRLQGANGQSVPLRYLVRMNNPSTRFVRLAKHSLGQNTPSSELLISRSHPLLVQGREVMPEHLVGLEGVSEVQLDEARYVYTLVTDRRSFANVAGAMVATWSEAAWTKYAREECLSWTRM